jgi:tRNA-2-methylthio-N6-dimethylallyladenosine synthase
MPDQVPDAVKAERNARLLEVTTRVATARSRRLVGRTVEVMVDGPSRKNPAELSGRTPCNGVVNFAGHDQVRVGDLAGVRITEALPHSLRGTLVASPEDAACLSR